MTLEFPFAARNPPQTIPTGHPSTPHEPKLERHRANAGLREAFYRERRGDAGGLVYPKGHLAPWPLARRRLHFTTTFIASLKTTINFLFFSWLTRTPAPSYLGVGGFKGLRPLPPTPRKRSRSRSSGVSNYPRRPFANSAIKNHVHLALRKKFAKPRFRLRIHHNA